MAAIPIDGLYKNDLSDAQKSQIQQLIKELNSQLANGPLEKENFVKTLTEGSAQCFSALPQQIQTQLLLDRDPHGNVNVSKIETERLFIDMVAAELSNRKALGVYQGNFNPQPLFLGYEGRACLPTNFDAQYCNALGYTAALLINGGMTGYMSGIKNLARPVEEWEPVGLPLVPMMGMEERKGKLKPRSNSRASSSERALVQTMTSRPQTSSTLS